MLIKLLFIKENTNIIILQFHREKLNTKWEIIILVHLSLIFFVWILVIRIHIKKINREVSDSETVRAA